MLSAVKDTNSTSNFSLNFRGNLTVYKQPIVMGIINTTPDSFYFKSRKNNSSSALALAEKMIREGADILDLGGYSSRPGAEDISVTNEISRVIPIIEEIKKKYPSQIISIDTFRTEVAEKAINAGADIINDINGGFDNSSIYELAADKRTPYVMMHMRGNAQNMNLNTEYNHLLGDIIYHFSKQIGIAQSFGLKDIILDPGIGFSKTTDQNFELIKRLSDLLILEKPILAGISRKSLIYKTLENTPEKALNGTTALHSICLMNGTKILRAHDVREAKETIKLFCKMY